MGCCNVLYVCTCQLGCPKKWQVLIFAPPTQNSERTYVEGHTEQILAISDNK